MWSGRGRMGGAPNLSYPTPRPLVHITAAAPARHVHTSHPPSAHPHRVPRQRARPPPSAPSPLCLACLPTPRATYLLARTKRQVVDETDGTRVCFGRRPSDRASVRSSPLRHSVCPAYFALESATDCAPRCSEIVGAQARSEGV
ncbi:hypothetical protein IQ07DRAFT_439617 [Pyrenochaeta sp. DS3sAY3a]|nr:hypothetical protein IQ07DRAFT_439617 [Pyrenochaeta sp. DS3sAY3a]